MKHMAVLALIALASPCAAQQITADRPGIGVDPETVPQWTLQPEVGTDGQEVRLGLAQGFEIEAQRGGGDSAYGAKLAIVDGAIAKASLRLAYDRQLGAVIEVPANITFTPWFNLGLDAMWSRPSQVYAAEFNFQPTKRLTITPTAYDDGRARVAIFAAWVSRDNLQFDIGFDQNRVSVGVSRAFMLRR